ncbi:hypothetical protein OIU76_001949 [Salix suchowensis]|nr:hypothetical protein OIU76_001949 [Salix suchowensis]
MVWTSTSPSPMTFPKEWSAYSGLKSLLNFSRGTDQNLTHTCYILHSYMIPAPPSPSWTTSPPLTRSLTNSSSYSSCSSALDDLIGTESGVCMNSNVEEETAQMEKLESYRNLPGHMPWILSRHYIDGKLVLVEERVKHHEYIEAHRENGRLILNIVLMDDKITCSHFVSRNEEEKELQDVDFLEENSDQDSDEEEDEEEGREAYQEIELANSVAVDDEEKYLVTASASLPKSSLKNGKSGDLRKCSTYAGRMISDINAHRNAGECMSSIHDLGPASFDLANILHKMTTVV